MKVCWGFNAKIRHQYHNSTWTVHPTTRVFIRADTIFVFALRSLHLLKCYEQTYDLSKGKKMSPTAESTDSPSTTFTRFTELQTELRLQIWNDSLPHNRIIEVVRGFRFNILQIFQNPVAGKLHIERYPHGNPVHFRACHESREQALRKFPGKLRFQIEEHFLRIDPREDILLIGNYTDEIDRNSCAIQRLGVEFTYMSYHIACVWFWQTLGAYEQHKELTIFSHSPVADQNIERWLEDWPRARGGHWSFTCSSKISDRSL